MPPPESLPAHPIVRFPFDDGAVDAIAAALGVSFAAAPFRVPDSAVYQATVEHTMGLPAVQLTLWPGIGRVDALSPSAAIVFTEVRIVDIVGTVEVQFRRANQELLIVARMGKVIVRA